jgi:hypothetical protein
MSVRQILKSREIVAVDARRTESERGESVRGGTGLTNGACVDPADACDHDVCIWIGLSAALLTETNQRISTQSRRGAKTT